MKFSRLLLAAFILAQAPVLWAQEDAPTSQPAAETKPKEIGAVRFVKTGKESGRLETAIWTFEDKDGRKVDLIGAVHIADRAYYKKLNAAFKNYDRLLYEMVKSDGVDAASIGKDGEPSGMGAFQKGFGKMLGLDYQLDHIDYGAENFVHADITAERMSQLMEERNINLFTIIMEALMDAFNQAAEGTQAGPQITIVDLVKLAFAKDRSHELKMILGPVMGDVEAQASGLGNSKIGKLILDERNVEAMKIVERELSTGGKNMGLFYGAAHLPGMAKIMEGLGFKKTAETWMTAWKVGTDKPEKTEKPTSRPRENV